MINLIERYSNCIEELQNNPNIKIIPSLTDSELNVPSRRSLPNLLDMMAETGFTLRDDQVDFFSIFGTSIGWEGKITKPEETVLDGGFKLKSLIESLIFPSDFWRGSFGIPLGSGVVIPDELLHFEQWQWFDKRPIGMGDARACFIKESDSFPPPLAFFYLGWYTRLDMDLNQYLELMFYNFAFKGWQFFYIDISNEMPFYEEVLEQMRNAVLMLPLNFPDKDWSYHIKRYEALVERL